MMKVGRRIGLFLAAALILSGCSNSAGGSGNSAAQTEAETSHAETERAGETAVTSLPQTRRRRTGGSDGSEGRNPVYPV